MTQTIDPIRTEEKAPPAPVRRLGDRVFKGLATGSGLTILLILAGVATFLTLKGIPALTGSAGAGLAYEQYDATGPLDFVWPLVFGTVWASVLAMLIAAPLAIGVALVISHYAPRPIAKFLGYLIDLLAAIPSVIYGLWGYTFLQSEALPVYQWLEENLGFLPFFVGPATTGRTILTAAIVLAIMALPIITAICREVFAQTPAIHQEAALALGATRWEMIRLTVFPYARSGMVSAIMLGLGRALGETMAVAMVLSATGIVSFDLISPENPSTIAANIALDFGNASGTKINVLIFSGLVLFIITFLVNFLGRWIANRDTRKG